MPKLTIDDQEIEVTPGTSILQAAEQLGIEIPRFCYHDKLSVPANCRMCLVELEGAPKPVASCALAAGDGMVIRTKSSQTKTSRKGVMEMLLINHPLDCPICDQGGECDLQDQAVAYGFDRARYAEHKRAVPNKNLGPLVETVMTRCINCTRCIRFSDEIAGVSELGQMNRSENAEVGTFVDKMLSTELSGNLIDVCPVGALTSKPYAYRARPWELTKTETIDVMDGLGCNIRLDSRGREVMRVLPRLNEDINEEWIDDRTRFSYDGLKNNRLDRPYIRKKTDGKLEPVSWEEAFTFTADKLRTFKGSKIAAFAGDLCDVESVMALKDLMENLGSQNIECRVDGARFDVSAPVGYRFNTSIAGIEKADAILLVGTNPRAEGVMVNARIRKTWLNRRIPVAMIGQAVDLTYPYEHLGDTAQDLEKLIKAKSGFAKVLKDAKRPMIIVGAGALAREDGLAIQALARSAAEKFDMVTKNWNGFNVMHMAAGRMGAIEIGFTSDKPITMDKMGLVYLMNVDTPEVVNHIHPQACVIYQGHHGDIGAARADIVFPGAAYSEKDGLYMNTEGRVQLARRAVSPPGEARADWKIIRALSGYCNKALRYDDFYQLRERLGNEFAQFSLLDHVADVPWEKFGVAGELSDTPLTSPVTNFYQTNVITKASRTMQACTDALIDHDEPAEEAA